MQIRRRLAKKQQFPPTLFLRRLDGDRWLRAYYYIPSSSALNVEILRVKDESTQSGVSIWFDDDGTADLDATLFPDRWQHDITSVSSPS